MPEPDPALPLEAVKRGEAPAKKSGAGLFRRVLKVLPVVPLVMALLMTGGVIGLYFQPPGVRKVMEWLHLAPGGGTSTPIAVPAPKSTPTAPAPRFVAGLGKLVPEGEVITLAPPFGAGDARLATLRVQEGQRVAAGDILGVLDNEGQLRAAVEGARATSASREATLAQVRASVEASRAEARAALARAETLAQNAAREFERAEELKRRGFAADQVFDQRRTQRDEAAREVERARASLSRYGTGPLDEQTDVIVAARNLDAARADLARATTDLERAYIRAPRDATVLSITAQPGEKPGASGIMNLGDIDHMKVEVEIYQTEIGKVQPGAAVEIVAPALPQALTGRVARVGLEVGRQSLTDSSPAANTDARVVKVTVALDAASNPIARRFTNLQVTARITVGAASP